MFDQMQLTGLQSQSSQRSAAVKFALDLSRRPVKDKPQVNNINLTSKSLENTLSNIFPTQKEENNLQRARRMLGDIAVSLTDPEIETYLTQFECLLDSWMDEFEKTIFDNKTLLELLKEG